MSRRYLERPVRRWTLWRLLTALVCVAAASALALVLVIRRYRLPVPTGTYAVGTRILDMTDASRSGDGLTAGRQRSLVAQIWYPASADFKGPTAPYMRWREAGYRKIYEPLIRTNSRFDAPVASAGEPFPVLIFGHSWGGQRVQNTALAEEFASHGYVVLAVDHPYNSGRVLLGDGRVIQGSPPIEGPKGPAATAQEQIDYWNRNLDVWAADDLFALNRLAALNASPNDPLRGHVDTNNVGAYGHSFGGAVALRLLGLDPRVKAGVNLDGWTYGGLDHRTAAQQAMIFYEQGSLDRKRELAKPVGPGPVSVEDQRDRADFASVEASFSRYGGTTLYVNGAQHMDFTDQPMMPPLHRGGYTGPVPPDRIHTILRRTLLEFFDRSLRGRPSTLLADPHAVFPEVTVEMQAGR